MSNFGVKRSGRARLELILVFAVVALIFQLFPSLWTGAVWALDVRNWPRNIWFAANLVVVFALVAIRLGPDLYQEVRRRRERLTAVRAKTKKQEDKKHQRETLERMKEARKRRVC